MKWMIRSRIPLQAFVAHFSSESEKSREP
jgi:hypothetical protein